MSSPCTIKSEKGKQFEITYQAEILGSEVSKRLALVSSENSCMRYVYLSALAVGKIQMDTNSLSQWMEDKMAQEKTTLGFMNLRKREFLFHIFASIAKYNS